MNVQAVLGLIPGDILIYENSNAATIVTNAETIVTHIWSIYTIPVQKGGGVGGTLGLYLPKAESPPPNQSSLSPFPPLPFYSYNLVFWIYCSVTSNIHMGGADIAHNFCFKSTK